MFSVYILQSLKDGRTYVGFTDNVKERLIRHNCGYVNATKYRRPFRVLFIERVKDVQEAKKREKYWKSGAGRRKLKYYFENGFPRSFEGERGSPKGAAEMRA